MRTDSCCCKRLPAHVVRKFASKHHRHFSRRNLLNLSSPDNSFFHWQMCLHGLLVQDAQHCSLNFPPDILSDHKVFPHFAGKLARARARRTDRKTHRLRWGNYRKWTSTRSGVSDERLRRGNYWQWRSTGLEVRARCKS